MFPYDEASHRIIEYYAVMAEILLGIESSKQSLLRLIAQGLSVNGYEKVPLFTSRDKVSMNWGARDFLEDQVSKIWLKSLKYDAIIKALGDSESEEIKGQEKLAKVKSIIGEVKSE